MQTLQQFEPLLLTVEQEVVQLALTYLSQGSSEGLSPGMIQTLSQALSQGLRQVNQTIADTLFIL